LIKVNLLPSGKRRVARRPRLSLRLPASGGLPKDPWTLVSGVVVLGLVAAAGFLYFATGSRQGDLTVAIERAASDSARYADLIEKNSALIARRDSIAQRVAIIQEIDGDRYVWPHVMDEVARALPDHLWLTNLFQVSRGEELRFRIFGRAGNNTALTQFMDNLASSLFIRNVTLISTEQVIETAAQMSRVVHSFQLEAVFDRPPLELLETVPLFEAPPSGPTAPPSGQ
jgi:Tfp pilus assembly protein PilN